MKLKPLGANALKRIANRIAGDYPAGMEIAYETASKSFPRPFGDTHAYFGTGETLCGRPLIQEEWHHEPLPSYLVSCHECQQALSSF